MPQTDRSTQTDDETDITQMQKSWTAPLNLQGSSDVMDSSAGRLKRHFYFLRLFPGAVGEWLGDASSCANFTFCPTIVWTDKWSGCWFRLWLWWTLIFHTVFWSFRSAEFKTDPLTKNSFDIHSFDDLDFISSTQVSWCLTVFIL